MITHKVFKSCEVKLVVFEIDICLFLILKVYNSFSNLKFPVSRYKLLQRDRNRNIGGFERKKYLPTPEFFYRLREKLNHCNRV